MLKQINVNNFSDQTLEGNNYARLNSGGILQKAAQKNRKQGETFSLDMFTYSVMQLPGGL